MVLKFLQTHTYPLLTVMDGVDTQGSWPHWDCELLVRPPLVTQSPRLLTHSMVDLRASQPSTMPQKPLRHPLTRAEPISRDVLDAHHSRILARTLGSREALRTAFLEELEASPLDEDTVEDAFAASILADMDDDFDN